MIMIMITLGERINTDRRACSRVRYAGVRYIKTKLQRSGSPVIVRRPASPLPTLAERFSNTTQRSTTKKKNETSARPHARKQTRPVFDTHRQSSVPHTESLNAAPMQLHECTIRSTGCILLHFVAADCTCTCCTASEKKESIASRVRSCNQVNYNLVAAVSYSGEYTNTRRT